MYRIEPTAYGFRITQVGKFSLEEVERYKSDVLSTLAGHDRPFSLLMDSRRLVLPDREVLEVFSQLHEMVWRMSCERSAIVVESPLARDMAGQACARSTYASKDRVIDARSNPNWEAMALAWVAEGVEPSSSGMGCSPRKHPLRTK